MYFKDSLNNISEAAYVYYWKNADGELPGGPADLYESHKMQEIAFSIPSAIADGTGKIYVEVDGVNSNELNFYARSTGGIYFVKTATKGGSDSNLGTWDEPWETLDYATDNSGIDERDTVYFVGNLSHTSTKIGPGSGQNGSENNRIALIVYPNSSTTILGTWGSGNYNTATHVTWSKLSGASDSNIISHMHDSRYVGWSITDVTCATGSTAAIAGTGETDGVKYFGMYIHNYGGNCSGNQIHPTYFSNRNGYPIRGFEFGWNYLLDNGARGGIHTYDEAAQGGWSTASYVHDNVVVNQAGSCIDVVGKVGWYNDTFMTGDIYIYNNICVNGGGPGENPDYNPSSSVVTIAGEKNKMHVYFYNNVLYGHASTTIGQKVMVSILQQTSWEANLDINFLDPESQIHFQNNIIYRTTDSDFASEDAVITLTDDGSNGNNLWYDAFGGATPASPTWDANPITSDPKFIAMGSDFHLQSDSPAIDNGTSSVSSVVTRDIVGTVRPQGIGYDIGVFEYVSGFHDADTDENGNISTSEIRSYVAQWKSSKVLLASVADAISIWKN